MDGDPMATSSEAIARLQALGYTGNWFATDDQLLPPAEPPPPFALLGFRPDILEVEEQRGARPLGVSERRGNPTRHDPFQRVVVDKRRERDGGSRKHVDILDD